MLRLIGLTKTFTSGPTADKHALDNINLTLDDGEFVTIIGDNGAGKSTLLNCISGVFEVDDGTIILDSDDITFSPEYQRARYIGRVFQDPLVGTAREMTIEENLSLASFRGRHRGLRPGIRRSREDACREQLSRLGLGLEENIRQKVGLLSGGQRQALTMLMAAMGKPKLLLLDEHTAALDPSTAEKVLKLTRDIVEQDRLTAIMVTHNMTAALEYGTRTVMMHEGRIILDIRGKERERMTVAELVKLFGNKSGKILDNDRMLLGN